MKPLLTVVRFGGNAWKRYVEEPTRGRVDLRRSRSVEAILEAVRRQGDRALVRYGERFDGIRLPASRLRVQRNELGELASRADRDVVRALRGLARRIRDYHEQQRETGFALEVPGGGSVEERIAPIPSVGLYVPGGAGAYPSSVLMTALPARVAGVPRLVVTTPPGTLEDQPAVAAALMLAGPDVEVYRVGGAQAIAALAFGTRALPRVHKIVGPGGAWVAEAKRQVRDIVATDADAGPSEVTILADDSADAGWVAADLLAQAEHGSGEERVVLVTTDTELADEVNRLVGEGLPSVANAAAARKALRRWGRIVLVESLHDGVTAVNALAPEHAELHCRRARSLARNVVAGAVFVGPWSPVAVGDYGIGPNHVLPTGGAARAASALSVRDFVRRQSVVELTRASLAHATDDIVRVAVAEGFPGHAQSVLTRHET